MTSVIWFQKAHENRNDLLRYGFMKLHTLGKIGYAEYPIITSQDSGFSDKFVSNEYPHVSIITVNDGPRTIRCLIDSEDSFFWMCPLISEVDCYFCAGYNSDFFLRKQMFTPYVWQTPADLGFYYRRADELISALGSYFGAVTKFVPIGPNMTSGPLKSATRQRWRNLKHKLHAFQSRSVYWGNQFLEFEARYSEMLSLRQSRLRYDIVLHDTLWGWPHHRVNLHRKLAEVSQKCRIHSTLNWSDPVDYDGSKNNPCMPSDFPMQTRPIVDYESMLASSRLAVFATGFHWGWRSIMAFALMVGLPIYMDRPVLEPWFDMNKFIIFWNEKGDWQDLSHHLNDVTDEKWQCIKKHNQFRYDEVMAPECVASYVIERALG